MPTGGGVLGGAAPVCAVPACAVLIVCSPPKTKGKAYGTAKGDRQ
jgi:hypothetical protein